jgi:hypothetical protein
MQLYQQLAESRVVGQKSSANQSSHVHADIHPQPPPQHHEEHHHHRRRHHHHMSRMDISRSESSHNESHFDKHEMYRLERVLCALRKNGQLKKARPGLQFCPGKYYEAAGCFKPADSGAPEGYLWLHASEPETRLLCHKMVFSAEQEPAAFEEIWACGEALPLRGLVLSLGSGSALCGLPLALWMS